MILFKMILNCIRFYYTIHIIRVAQKKNILKFLDRIIGKLLRICADTVQGCLLNHLLVFNRIGANNLYIFFAFGDSKATGHK